MVWYVPPLSPVVSMVEGDGYEADPDDVFAAIDELRIPLEYLANLLTAGDAEPVRARAASGSPRCAATCASGALGGEPDAAIADAGRPGAGRDRATCTGCSRSPTTTTAT